MSAFFERTEPYRNPFLDRRYALDREQFEPVMDEFYTLHGWDIERGWPTRERLCELGLEDDYHAFLVPDEGYSIIVRLHDRLYADRLFSQRALTVDFIPHIGIGNSKDPLKCLEMVRVWNKGEFAIPGRVVALDIANYENDSVETIERVLLEDI